MALRPGSTPSQKSVFSSVWVLCEDPSTAMSTYKQAILCLCIWCLQIMGTPLISEEVGMREIPTLMYEVEEPCSHK